MTVFRGILLPSVDRDENLWTLTTPWSASRERMSSSLSLMGTFLITPLMSASDMTSGQFMLRLFTAFKSRSCFFCFVDDGYMLRSPLYVHFVPDLTCPTISVRACMKCFFSVILRSRNDLGSLVRCMITGAPLHGWSNRSEKRRGPGRGLWLSLVFLRLVDIVWIWYFVDIGICVYSH